MSSFDYSTLDKTVDVQLISFISILDKKSL